MAFKVGTTRDLLTASGKPAFNEAAFEELARNTEIEWEWIPETLSEITPEIAARYDGLTRIEEVLTADQILELDARIGGPEAVA